MVWKVFPEVFCWGKDCVGIRENMNGERDKWNKYLNMCEKETEGKLKYVWNLIKISVNMVKAGYMLPPPLSFGGGKYDRAVFLLRTH